MKKTKKYKVSLLRSYVVIIEADDKRKAKNFAEFYLGDCYDISRTSDKVKNNFSILEIEPTINEAMDVEEI